MTNPSQQAMRLGFGFSLYRLMRLLSSEGVFERVIGTRASISILEASPAS
ncbi:hypothetical protein [Mesorhizobium sp. WSM3860]|nr:hypothetical protein [Mesorhizobium sp. WSM3860]